MDALKRNNVHVIGEGERTFLLAHGFGCDQNMWQFLVPQLTGHGRLVLFDFVGSGRSDISAYSSERYSQLDGYARDVLEVMAHFADTPAVFVGHSVGASVGMIAADRQPELFSHLALVCPSPCFINDPPDYEGGFERSDLEELIDLMDQNYIGWAEYLAPLVAGADADQEIVGTLSGSFCSTDPIIARNFAMATFFSDQRALLPRIRQPSLILQSRTDTLAPVAVGRYMQQQIPNSHLVEVDAMGHCLHMTHPQQVSRALAQFLDPAP